MEEAARVVKGNYFAACCVWGSLQGRLEVSAESMGATIKHVKSKICFKEVLCYIGDTVWDIIFQVVACLL